MRLPLDLVIFDMAGTTVRDDGQVPAAFTTALVEHGIDISAAQINGVRGASKREAILALVPEGAERNKRAERVYASFRAQLAQRYAMGVSAIPGAVDAFLALRECGVRVALNTGFDRDTAGLLLNALGWEQGTVDVVVCGEDVAKGRPAPDLIFRAMELAGTTDARKIANVGDTTLDLRAGHNAGVRWNIGVLSGAHDREALEKEPHTHLLASVAELPELLLGNEADY